MCFGLMCILTKILFEKCPRLDFPKIWEGRAAVLSALSTSNINVLFHKSWKLQNAFNCFCVPLNNLEAKWREFARASLDAEKKLPKLL